jgi:hypothetical protein
MISRVHSRFLKLPYRAAATFKAIPKIYVLGELPSESAVLERTSSLNKEMLARKDGAVILLDFSKGGPGEKMHAAEWNYQVDHKFSTAKYYPTAEGFVGGIITPEWRKKGDFGICPNLNPQTEVPPLLDFLKKELDPYFIGASFEVIEMGESTGMAFKFTLTESKSRIGTKRKSLISSWPKRM